jgi:signal peptidase I
MTVRRFAYVSLVVAVIALAVVVVKRTVVATVPVTTAAMSPTLEAGDVVAAQRGMSVGKVKRGDIVVVRVASSSDVEGPAMFPRSGGDLVLRRVVGLPNEGIEVNQSGVRVVSQKSGSFRTLAEPYVETPGGALLSYTEISDDQFVVLSDQRLGSESSGSLEDVRAQGVIPVRAVVGVVRWQVWPLSDVRALRMAGVDR